MSETVEPIDPVLLSRRVIAGGAVTRDEARELLDAPRRGGLRSLLRRPQGPPSLPRRPRHVL